MRMRAGAEAELGAAGSALGGDRAVGRGRRDREGPRIVARRPQFATDIVAGAIGIDPVRNAELVLLNLPTTDAVEQAVFGPDGVASAIEPPRIVVDFWFYFFTRPGSALRAYLHGAGNEQVVFFSPQSLAQWDAPTIVDADVAR